MSLIHTLAIAVLLLFFCSSSNASLNICHNLKGEYTEHQETTLIGSSCSCPGLDDSCQLCQVSSTSELLGCVRCTDDKFLDHSTKKCVDVCPDGTVTIDRGKRGSECRPNEYTCINGIDENSLACFCPQDNCKTCSVSTSAQDYICLECHPNGILANGNCHSQLRCKGKKFVIDGVDTDASCDCGETGSRKCKKCVTTATVNPDDNTQVLEHRCTSCRGGHFLFEDECLDQSQGCPEHLASYGMHSTFGRMCINPGVTCFKEKFRGSPELESTPCRCPDFNCRSCYFGNDTSNSSGQLCSKCKRPFMLYEGQCVSTCPSPFIKFGTECVEPFTCDNGKDPLGRKCICPENCDVCRKEIDDTFCLKCETSRFLYQGQCLKQCQGQLVESINDSGVPICELPSMTTTPIASSTNPTMGTTTSTSSCQVGQNACMVCENDDCRLCGSNKFLLKGNCVDECPENYIEDGSGFVGKSCTMSSTSTVSSTTKSTPTTTAKSTCQVGQNACMVCENDDCRLCGSNKFLLKGNCVDECPENYIENGSGFVGKTCDLVVTSTTTATTTIQPSKQNCNDDSLHPSVKSACESCPGNTGVFQRIDSEQDLASVIQYPPARSKVSQLINDISQKYFDDSKFSVAILPANVFIDMNGTMSERFCLSFDLDIEARQSFTLFSRLFNRDIEQNVLMLDRLTSIFPDDFMSNIKTGLFTIPLQFKMLGITTPELEVDESRQENLGIYNDVIGVLDNFESAQKTLLSLNLPAINLGDTILEAPLLRILSEGLGFNIDRSIQVQSLLKQFCSDCSLTSVIDEWRSALNTQQLSSMLDRLLQSSVNFVAFELDDGDLSWPLESFVSNSSLYCLENMDKKSCFETFRYTIADKTEFQSDDQLADRIISKLQGMNLESVTHDIVAKFNLDDGFTVPILGWSVKNLKGNFKLINFLNNQQVDRDYCRRDLKIDGKPAYNYLPPPPRHYNVEISAIASFGSFLEIPVILKSTTKVKPQLDSQRSCSSDGVLTQDIPQALLENENSWQLEAFFPRVSLRTVFCTFYSLASNMDILQNEECASLFSGEFSGIGLLDTIMSSLETFYLSADFVDLTKDSKFQPTFQDGPRYRLQIDGEAEQWLHEARGMSSFLDQHFCLMNFKFLSGQSSDSQWIVGFELPNVNNIFEFAAKFITLPGFNDAFNLIAGRTLIRDISVTLASADINFNISPQLKLDMSSQRKATSVYGGLTISAVLTYLDDCDDIICNFMFQYFGIPELLMGVNIKFQPKASVTTEGALGQTVLLRDDCYGPNDSPFELGRPVMTLDKVAVFSTFDSSSASFGFKSVLTLDIGNIEKQIMGDGDFCNNIPSDKNQYQFFKPLVFTVVIQVKAGSLEIAGSMKGVYSRVLGLPFLHLSNIGLLSGVTAALGIPPFEMEGEASIGTNCYTTSSSGWIKNQDANCLDGFGAFEFHPTDISKNYVAGGLFGLTFQNIIDKIVLEQAQFDLPDFINSAQFPKLTDDEGKLVANPVLHYSASPTGTVTMNGVQIPFGTTFSGQFRLDKIFPSDFAVSVSIASSPFSAIKISGRAPAIKFEEILKIVRSSNSDAEGPQLLIDTESMSSSGSVGSLQVILKGVCKLLGFSASADVELSNDGAQFDVSGKVFNLFEANVDAMGPVDFRSDNIDEWHVQGEFGTELPTKLKALVDEILEAAANAASHMLSQAQEAVNTATEAAQAATSTLANAAADVVSADAQRKAANAAYNAAASSFSSAQSAVSSAARKVNSASSALSSAQDDCEDATDLVGSACDCGRICIQWGPCVCGNPLYVSCGAYRVTADRLCGPVLSAARSTLSSAQSAYSSAVRTANSAQSALNSAKSTAESWQRAYSDAVDARSRAQQALDAANAAVESAQAGLNQVMEVAAVGLEVVDFLADYAIDTAVTIESISFGGKLQTFSKASFDATVEFTVTGSQKQLSVSINFDNLVLIAREIVEEVFEGIGQFYDSYV